MNYSHYHLIKEFIYTVPHTVKRNAKYDFVWMPLHHCKTKSLNRRFIQWCQWRSKSSTMYQLVRRCGVFRPWWWRQQSPPICWQLLTNWHSTIKQKTVLLIILTKTVFKIYLQRHIAKFNAKLACTPTNNRFHDEVVSGTYSKWFSS